MENLLRKAVETRKNYLIKKLLKAGVYKKGSTHLYLLTLSELEEEFNREIIINRNKCV
ncbi:Fur-regulated basic protein FbpA [Gottfriedia acidiceleris]|uniref:Fur-regulated basic protein FbpA n=1 Tax=Gottfriedia acidiceleris TaxID=371036 RepID=UPI000B4485CE|nr:Fur-regulated basic protein FbpA [Gottfriedia acidiceleris]